MRVITIRGLLKSLEGDRENTMNFYFHFYLVFLPETEDMTLYNDKSY